MYVRLVEPTVTDSFLSPAASAGDRHCPAPASERAPPELPELAPDPEFEPLDPAGPELDPEEPELDPWAPDDPEADPAPPPEPLDPGADSAPAASLAPPPGAASGTRADASPAWDDPHATAPAIVKRQATLDALGMCACSVLPCGDRRPNVRLPDTR